MKEHELSGAGYFELKNPNRNVKVALNQLYVKCLFYIVVEYRERRTITIHLLVFMIKSAVQAFIVAICVPKENLLSK